MKLLANIRDWKVYELEWITVKKLGMKWNRLLKKYSFEKVTLIINCKNNKKLSGIVSTKYWKIIDWNSNNKSILKLSSNKSPICKLKHILI